MKSSYPIEFHRTPRQSEFQVFRGTEGSKISRLHVVVVIKRLLYVEFRGLGKKKENGKTGGAGSPEWAIAHFLSSVATENSLLLQCLLCHDMVLKLGARPDLGARDIVRIRQSFWLCVPTEISLS